MREVGDKPGISMLVNNAGELALRQGDPARAELLFEESLALDREIGDSSGLAYGLTNLGQAALLQGNPDRAEDLLGKGLRVLSQAGDRVLSAGGLEWVGMAAAMSGRPERAARLWGAAEALRESTASTMTPFVRGYYESHVHTVRSQLDDSSFQRAWSEGNAMSLERAVAYALEDTATS
jgi:tetratricopeptide (TPR) repeat protein